MQASHAWVFRSIDAFVHAHVIPSIGTLTQAKIKAHVRLVLDSYLDDLMCIATNVELVISENTMHQYVVGMSALKKMMHAIRRVG